MPKRSRDEIFMAMALKLAARGGNATRPNPKVGAVVVRSGRVVGRGFHRRTGGPHAEVFALRQAGKRSRGATLYVSLEPCTHTGRTGPCVDLIRQAGIRRVVAAMVDPNPKNRGRGLRLLKASGVGVKVGVLGKEARLLNRIFITWMEKKRPFVTVKVAQSLDGKIATVSGESRWISGPQSREWVHRLRSEVDAIMVGIRTVLKDNPRLTVRSGGRGRGAGGVRNPLKIVLDSRLRTPPVARIFSSKGSVVIAAGENAPASRERSLRRAGAKILRFPSVKGRVNLVSLLEELACREVSHLLVEGGAEVIASALEAGVVDRIACIVAPKIIGGRRALTSVGGQGIASLERAIPVRNLSVKCLGSDFLIVSDVGNKKGERG